MSLALPLDAVVNRWLLSHDKTCSAATSLYPQLENEHYESNQAGP